MENNSTVELAKHRLNEWLKQGIVSPGSKLPSERELEELLGIKRMTLRQALLYLEGESKIFRKDRRGWFVALPRFNYSPNSSTSFKQAAMDQGRLPSWGYLAKECVCTAPPEILSLLEVTAGAAVGGHWIATRCSITKPISTPRLHPALLTNWVNARLLKSGRQPLPKKRILAIWNLNRPVFRVGPAKGWAVRPEPLPYG